MDPAKDLKPCFVIAPIGSEGSEIRIHSDKVFRHIVEPSLRSAGYKAERSDHIEKPGIIPSQVLKRIVEDSLVVADLTGHNPNVFYELAVRHTLGKPTVMIIAAGEQLPFDVAQSRTIFFDIRDLDSVQACKEKIAAQIAEIESSNSNIENPVSHTLDLQALQASRNPNEQALATIIETLRSIELRLDRVKTAEEIDPVQLARLEAKETLSKLRGLLFGKGDSPYADIMLKVLQKEIDKQSSLNSKP